MAEKNWFLEIIVKATGGNEEAVNSFSNFFGSEGILADIGFYTYVLPFLLVFAITYAALRQIPPFDDRKRISGVISMVFGLYVTTSTGFLRWYKGVSSGITQIMAVVLIILVFLMIIYELFSYFGEEEGQGE